MRTSWKIEEGITRNKKLQGNSLLDRHMVISGEKDGILDGEIGEIGAVSSVLKNLRFLG